MILRDALEALPAPDMQRDPVQFAHRYDTPEDQEIAGFLAAGLAYGRVAAFLPRLEEIFELLDVHGGPRAFLATGPHAGLEDWQYRWNRGADHQALFVALARILDRHGSLGALVQGSDMIAGLSTLVHTLRNELDWSSASHGLRYLLPDPAGPSAAKRMHMYARWMVRRDGVDLGLWQHLHPRDLIIPLDTHVHRIARLVGLCTRTKADRKGALEVTAALRELDPEDPVRFDFALAHLGISQGCRGQRDPVCDACSLRPLCKVWTEVC